MFFVVNNLFKIFYRETDEGLAISEQSNWGTRSQTVADIDRSNWWTILYK